MDILCGNLVELKEGAVVRALNDTHDPWSGALSNVPFTCCLNEYGQPLDEEDVEADGRSDGWIRLYEIFETTVQ